MNKSNILLAGAACALLLAGCNRDKDRQDDPPEPKAATRAMPGSSDGAMPAPATGAAVGSKPAGSAFSTLKPASGSQVSGSVRFMEMGGGLHLQADISGLAPGKHGFHIHQIGDCSAPDAKSAGDHFNPDAQQHGGHDSAVRHRGDLGNLDAGADGRASADKMIMGLALAGPDSVIGKSVPVHAAEDDLKTPPSGNSGARIACGVIEAS